MAIENPNDSLKSELAAKTSTTAAAAAPAAQTTPLSTPATPAEATPSNPYDYQNRISSINQMYDSALNSARTNLDTAYEQNRSNLEANRQEIAQAYQNQRNANAADYERARRNFNQQALANGLNTGAASQAALAQNAVYNKNQGTLGAAEASANAELDRALADLKVRYQNDINSAIAENDYNRAATLLDEYNNQYNMAMSNAHLLSQYGDFSGYANLFGQGTADQMRQMWAYQNPELAYNTGSLSSDDYYKLMARNNAQLLAQYGDFSGYASVFGQDAANQMRQMWMYQNPEFAYNTGDLSADDYYKLMTRNNAQLLASYGDFSGYASVFGQEAANQMRQMWLYQNPGIAYSLGEISADDYYGLTGSYPPGYSGGSYYYGGGGGGGGYYYSGSGSENGGGTADSTGIVTGSDGLQYTADGTPLPAGGTSPEAGTRDSSRQVPDAISGKTNTFAGERGGPSLDPDADPMAGRTGQSQNVRQDWSTSASASQAQPASVSKYDPALVKAAETGRRQVDLPSLTNTLNDVNRTTGLKLNQNLQLLGNLASTSDSGQAQPLAVMRKLRELYPEAPNDLLEKYAWDYADMADIPGKILSAPAQQEANRQALMGMLQANQNRLVQDNVRSLDTGVSFTGAAPVLRSNGSLARVEPSGASGNSNSYQANYQSMQQKYVDSLNAQEQAKADQYNRGNQQIYIPAKYQVINGTIYHTTGHFTGNPQAGLTSGTLMPGYARQDSSNWIMGPNFRIPMTTNVSR